jgi:hypothetical protein
VIYHYQTIVLFDINKEKKKKENNEKIVFPFRIICILLFEKFGGGGEGKDDRYCMINNISYQAENRFLLPIVRRL